MTLGGAAQVAAAHCPNKQTLDHAVCSCYNRPTYAPASCTVAFTPRPTMDSGNDSLFLVAIISLRVYEIIILIATHENPEKMTGCDLVVTLRMFTVLSQSFCNFNALLQKQDSEETSFVTKIYKGVCIAIYGNPSHNYGVSLAVWDHTVLPSTQHKRTHPAFTPARQAGTRFTDHLHKQVMHQPLFC